MTEILAFLNSPVGIALVVGVLGYFAPRLGINVPWGPKPVDPANPTPAPAPLPTSLNAIVEAVLKAVLERFLPHVQEIVRTEIANRPPAGGGTPVSIEAKADGSTAITSAGLSVTTAPKQ
jgi:hypothetical protein